MHRKWGRTAAALVATVVVLAACGQGVDSAGDGNGLDISAVSESTEAANTARIEGSFGGGPGRFSGEIDWANDRSVMRTSYPAGGDVSITATSDEGEIAVDDRGSVETDPVEAEIRTVDGYTYFETSMFDPSDEETRTPTKPWMRAQLGLGGAGAAMLPFGQSADVSGMLEILDAIGITTEAVGTEDVRGTPTTRYRLSLGDPPDVPAEVEAIGNFSMERGEDVYGDLWVDDQNRLRRFRADSGESDESGERNGAYEFELFDFGVPVNVEAPPSDQVETAPMGGGAGPPEPAQLELVTSGSGWKLFASSTDNSRCWAVETDVAPYFGAAYRSQDGRVELGCSGWGSAMAPESATDIPVVPVSAHVELEAIPLADGQALLFANVPDGTTKVVLRMRGGDVRDATAENGYFGAVLGHDEVVETIEFTTPGEPVECVLEKDLGYECDPELRRLRGSDSGSGSVSTSLPAPTTVVPAPAP